MHNTSTDWWTQAIAAGSRRICSLKAAIATANPPSFPTLISKGSRGLFLLCPSPSPVQNGRHARRPVLLKQAPPDQPAVPPEPRQHDPVRAAGRAGSRLPRCWWNDKGKKMGASTDAGEVGTLAVSLPGLATGRVSLASSPHPDSTTRSERLAGHAQQTTAVREK
jgi:hypothetical protein